MKKIFKRTTVWVTAMTLALGMAVVPASAAPKTAPSIQDVDYSANGVVEVEFKDNVKYKKAKVTVKDNKGKSYKTKVVKKDSDDIKFKIKKVKKNRTYTFKIKGVKKVGTSKFVTVKGKVKAPKKNVNKKKLIGKAEAKSIAYANAKVNAADVKDVRVEFDYDDGRAIYEVDFYTETAEYEYDIAATSGKILDKDVDKIAKRQVKPNKNDNSKYIGAAKAKSIALGDAGLKASDVKFIKAEFDRDDGVAVYEVEFYKGFLEYEYTINATDGSIMEMDVEYDD